MKTRCETNLEPHIVVFAKCTISNTGTRVVAEGERMEARFIVNELIQQFEEKRAYLKSVLKHEN